MLKTLDELWPFIVDKKFVCIHWFYDHQSFLSNPDTKDFTPQDIKYLV